MTWITLNCGKICLVVCERSPIWEHLKCTNLTKRQQWCRCKRLCFDWSIRRRTCLFKHIFILPIPASPPNVRLRKAAPSWTSAPLVAARYKYPMVHSFCHEGFSPSILPLASLRTASCWCYTSLARHISSLRYNKEWSSDELLLFQNSLSKCLWPHSEDLKQDARLSTSWNNWQPCSKLKHHYFTNQIFVHYLD